MAEVPGVDDSRIFAIAIDIEESVLDKHGGETEVVSPEYRNKVRSLSLNLKDKKNPQFRQRVVKGEVPARTLVDLSPAVSIITVLVIEMALSNRSMTAFVPRPPANGVRGTLGRKPIVAGAEHARCSKRSRADGRDGCLPVRQVQAEEMPLLSEADEECRRAHVSLLLDARDRTALLLTSSRTGSSLRRRFRTTFVTCTNCNHRWKFC